MVCSGWGSSRNEHGQSPFDEALYAENMEKLVPLKQRLDVVVDFVKNLNLDLQALVR